jgi:hypothetical protein
MNMRDIPLSRWRERVGERVDIYKFPLTCILSPWGEEEYRGIFNVDHFPLPVISSPEAVISMACIIPIALLTVS